MTVETRVLYNDECPICSFEIGHYRGYANKTGLPLRFDALSGPDLARWKVSRDDAARRLHVLKDGEVLTGVDAFIALWSEMPRYRWLARIVTRPVIRPAAAMVYDRILAPLLYRAHLRRTARLAPH
ncbi:DUF393 domain-containing protein [Ponticoccus sp. SC2-23]|nr:DUF393 domain-containing protein [Alexandriicola marinus]MBM1219901.1 DUF393 domain-containing protein [Ponticoccus sp. SC6-9]MBM1224587.1 DUF393 domain-containing protein [Ponticoccus sp. SC6-15]MBM1228100.1 DUF393 domain-containing protein [Ponticoccus sp. SC6-38]MBM1234262.1 DUF393 domain-containing protein [Ponticoccus sp. SC6-45]MBM1238602.1 DUF393 domain-containing protein [Ponticoccus sp. SC6-49]MBM1242383.1 DUF393 domain-containing protein [Ponticoccus sp. SC2-64]MBM1247786.1 DUF3